MGELERVLSADLGESNLGESRQISANLGESWRILAILAVSEWKSSNESSTKYGTPMRRVCRSSGHGEEGCSRHAWQSARDTRPHPPRLQDRVRRSSDSSKLGNPFNMHRDEINRDNVCEAFDVMLRKIVDTEGGDDDAGTELWAAQQTQLEGRLRPDPTNRRPNTEPGERWNELVPSANELEVERAEARVRHSPWLCLLPEPMPRGVHHTGGEGPGTDTERGGGERSGAVLGRRERRGGK